MDGSLEVILEDQDEVRIFTLDEVEGDDQILLSGFGLEDSVTIPWRENLKLYDFVFSNSPFEEKEFSAGFLRSRIDVKRFNVETGLFYTIPLNIDLASAVWVVAIVTPLLFIFVVLTTGCVCVPKF